MAEVGNMPLPAKLLRQGITDMVRISDARMSGTAYGTVVLHAAPEAAAGGPLALVKNGDLIELDVERRRLHLEVSDEELKRRRSAWKTPTAPMSRGYWKLYVDHVNQADEGADLDFLVGKSGSASPATTTDDRSCARSSPTTTFPTSNSRSRFFVRAGVEMSPRSAAPRTT